jgi:predicted lipoprotein with Yx(FWY)xxD motif
MTTQPQTSAGARLLLRVVGAGLLIATAAVHLDLYLTGYRTIPTIGALFLLQAIVGFVLGLAVLATGSRLVAAVGALFALSTLGGYLLSVQFGLFGFREVRTTAGIVAGVLEVLAFASLAVLAATGRASARHAHRSLADRNYWAGRASDGVSGVQAGFGAAAISVVAAGLLAGALANAGGSANNGGTTANQVSGSLKTEDVQGTTVLANAAGKTLYWFAPDKANKSVCYGSCAAYWPPVAGPVTAPAGVQGTFGTIHRTDGHLQETYNGHPLYTYIGDSGPGQASGNKVNLNGGFWYEVVVSG